jgi:CzcA family heavy metal efflux pump
MIRSVISASLRFRLLVLALAAGILAVGIAQLGGARADVLPEFTPPYVEIQMEALGLSAEEVEQLITVPMEADLLNGVEGIDVLRSQSIPGMSSIVLVFDSSADLYRSRALVQERLAQKGTAALPRVSKPPVMLQPYSSSSRVLIFGLESDKVSPIEKSVMARWTVQPRLLGVPGVANVSIWGFRDRQLHVQVDPERLADRGVTLSQVVETTANAQISSPLTFVEGSTPGTGGFIETPQQRLGVRHVFDKLADPEQLAKVPVQGTGGKLRLGDVSDVVVDHQPLIGDAVVNDGDGLLLVVEKFAGANTLEVTRGVEKALEDLKPGLGGMEADTSIFRPASFIETAMDNLRLASLIGGVLLALMLAAFLFAWRTVLIGLFTIPLALVTAGLVLHLLGETFNAISFLGLAIAMVVVVDSAVAGAENVARRVHEERELGGNASMANIVRDATHEVRSPLAYATLIALIAIVPVALMQGRPGAFFESLVLGYALAVTAAIVVALTVTPAFALLLFSLGAPARRESPLVLWLRSRYGNGFGRFVRKPRTALVAGGATLVCAVVALAALPLLGTSLIPSFKDTDVLVRLNAEPGTSNTRMTQITTDVSRELRSLPGVDNVGAAVGRAVTGDRIVDVNSAELFVSMDPDADHSATMGSIELAVANLTGVRTDVATYSQQKIRDVGALREGQNPVTGNGLDVLTGADKPLVVRVYGQSLAALRREAGKVRELVADIDGVVDPRVDQPIEQPNVVIDVDLDKAREFGIKPGEIRRAEATLVEGLSVGSVFEEQKVFDVVVVGTPETRRSVESIKDLLVDRPDGGHVRLGDVADVRVGQAPIAIARDSVSRYLDVEAEVSGRSVEDVAADVEERLAGSVFPLEYHAEVQSESTGAEINSGMMLGAAVAAALAALLLLQAAFRSWRLAALVFATLPVALLGGAVAALIDGAELSLGAAAGLLALFGLAVHNGVLMVCHFQRMRERDGEPFGMELVHRGARARLAPMVTTTAALALGALPFAVLGVRPGLEIVSPMAIVLLGGLVTSTFLSLFLLPALYLRFGEAAETEPVPEELLVWALPEPAAVAALPPVLVPVESGDRVDNGDREGKPSERQPSA